MNSIGVTVIRRRVPESDSRYRKVIDASSARSMRLLVSATRWTYGAKYFNAVSPEPTGLE